MQALLTVKIPADNRRGWKLVNADDPRAVVLKGATTDDMGALRATYEAKFGKRPFMGWDAEKLRSMIGEAS